MMILDAILVTSGMLLGIAVLFGLLAWAISQFLTDFDD